MRYAIILLAAGQSTRMGSCKLEIRYEQKTLLEHAITAAIESQAHHTVVVAGAYPDVVHRTAEKYPVDVTHNPNYSTGIASSIKAGLQYVKLNYSVDAVIISVSDQFYLRSINFNALMDKHEANKEFIVASLYQGILGVPCLFPKNTFGLLESIDGDIGARKILNTHQDKLCFVPFANGWKDLDSPSDLIDLPLDEDNEYV